MRNVSLNQDSSECRHPRHVGFRRFGREDSLELIPFPRLGWSFTQDSANELARAEAELESTGDQGSRVMTSID